MDLRTFKVMSLAMPCAADNSIYPPQSKIDMQTDSQPVRISLEELRSFAAALTDGSLLKRATLRVIAEQEDRQRRQEAKAHDLYAEQTSSAVANSPSHGH
ncbi:hypothetical protein P3W85_43380 [Cupriavidus basilensis]|uniref:Uncharacterized protein n=1 Tax=Cupriavidus basilensis TaxID=68895 RepID=A0ABT6B4J6_9BURK|nr:hypothetical protein [Cupriavidus basilensis]MDF3839733.1 hypothetical protein [Cupriavidus basilensis]